MAPSQWVGANVTTQAASVGERPDNYFWSVENLTTQYATGTAMGRNECRRPFKSLLNLEVFSDDYAFL